MLRTMVSMFTHNRTGAHLGAYAVCEFTLHSQRNAMHGVDASQTVPNDLGDIRHLGAESEAVQRELLGRSCAAANELPQGLEASGRTDARDGLARRPPVKSAGIVYLTDGLFDPCGFHLQHGHFPAGFMVT